MAQEASGAIIARRRPKASSLDDDREVVTHGPRRTKGLKRKRSFSLEWIEHDDLILTGVDNDDGVNLFNPINRTKINESDRMMTVGQKQAQFAKSHCVLGGSRESKLPSDINHHQGIGAKVRGAITLPAQLTLRDVEAETA